MILQASSTSHRLVETAASSEHHELLRVGASGDCITVQNSMTIILRYCHSVTQFTCGRSYNEGDQDDSTLWMPVDLAASFKCQNLLFVEEAVADI